MAIQWAQDREEVLPDRVSFFGTSQGGGASLLLGSLYQGRGVRCVAADLPWMPNFPLAKERMVAWHQFIFSSIETMSNPEAGWYALGMIDPLSHARRLTVPVMLTAGSEDANCLPETIESLFDRLPATRTYCYLHGQGHDYTQQFIALAGAWFRLYA
jgi:cephalosporin-C deacetylase-like acetyl esterase